MTLGERIRLGASGGCVSGAWLTGWAHNNNAPVRAGDCGSSGRCISAHGRCS